MQREEEREEAPDWLGPVIGLLILIVLAGLVTLFWLTIFSDHGEAEGGALAPPAVIRSYMRA